MRDGQMIVKNKKCKSEITGQKKCNQLLNLY